MENVILYTTHCPRCLVLANKLQEKGIHYCNQYRIAIIDFDADTEIHVDVQSCIDEVVP